MDFVFKLGIIVIVFIIYVYFENLNLEVTHYKVHSDKIPSGFDGARFVVLADLHNNCFGKDNSRLLDAINQVKPDFILVAGDMIIGRENDYSVAFSLLSNLAKEYKIYYGFGNHEQRVLPGGIYSNKGFKEYKEELEKLGVTFLDNERIRITRHQDTIMLTGLQIDKKFFQKWKHPNMEPDYLQKLVGIPDNQCYNIMIAHNPVYFKKYADYGADLIVSGHLHGGLVRLPGLGGMVSPQYRLFPRYDAGRFDYMDRTMLVSRGLGMHTIKLRVWNRPELMVVTLED